MRIVGRFSAASCLLAFGACGVGREVSAQQATTTPLPASAVMASGPGDGWQSRGGVVGPWWSGSSAGVQPPAADGGFWFGLPGLGFGGTQGSSRSLGGVGSTLTTVPGAAGMVSSSRLTPFVTGVIPVVGGGYPSPMTRSGFGQTMLPTPRPSQPQSVPTGLPHGSSALSPIRRSTPASRARSQRLVAAGDQHLIEDPDGPTAARAALDDYRAAGRFAQDDCDILIRQALLYAALGQLDQADRAIARAVQIDGRLAAPMTSGPDTASSHPGSSPDARPAVAARGETIIRELAALDHDRPAADAPVHAVIDWLEAAWKTHWSAAAPEPASWKP